MFIRINSALRCVGNKANPTSIRRHVASPSRLHLRFLAALWFAPARLRLDYPSPEGDRFYLFPHPANTIFPGLSRPLPAAQIWMVHQPSVSASRICDLNITLSLLCATLLYSELQIRIKNTKILCLRMRSCIYVNSLTTQWFSLKKCRSYSTLTALSILTKATKIQVLTECFREVRFIVLVSET